MLIYTEVITFKVTPEQKEKLSKIDKCKFLRNQIDALPELPNKSRKPTLQDLKNELNQFKPLY